MAPKRKPCNPTKPRRAPRKLRLGCPTDGCPGELQRRYLNQADALQCNSCHTLYLVSHLCVIPVVLTEH